MDTFSLLRATSFFEGLDDDAVHTLARCARTRSYAPGERIVRREEKKQAFYIVLSGRVKIYRTSTEGREQTLYLVDEGQPFCFCTAFANKPYPVNVSALEQALVANIPAADMETLARQDPKVMLRMLQTLSARLLDAMNMVESLALHGIQQRVASFLLHAEAREAAAPGREFALPVSHREMAKIVGTTPETVSRVVQKLKADELITASGRKICILDRNGLETG